MSDQTDLLWGGQTTALINESSDATTLLAECSRLYKQAVVNYFDLGRSLYLLYYTGQFCTFDYEKDPSKTVFEKTPSQFQTFLRGHGLRLTLDEIEKRMKVYCTYWRCSEDQKKLAATIGLDKAMTAIPYIDKAIEDDREADVGIILAICRDAPSKNLGLALMRYPRTELAPIVSIGEQQAERERRVLKALHNADPSPGLTYGELFVPRRKLFETREEEAEVAAIYAVIQKAQGLASLDETFMFLMREQFAKMTPSQKGAVTKLKKTFIGEYKDAAE